MRSLPLEPYSAHELSQGAIRQPSPFQQNNKEMKFMYKNTTFVAGRTQLTLIVKRWKSYLHALLLSKIELVIVHISISLITYKAY